MTTTFLLQDWTTKAGPDSDVEIIQSDIGWLDLAGYTDVAFYLSVPFVNVEGLTLYLETAPSKDDNLFRSLQEIEVAVTARAQYLNRLANVGDEPLTRWVRWRLAYEGEGDWKVTFRIWLCATRRGRPLAPPPAVYARPGVVVGRPGREIQQPRTLVDPRQLLTRHPPVDIGLPRPLR